MSRASLYLALAGLGFAVQAAITVVFLAESGLDLGEFGEQAVQTTIAVLGLADLIMTAVVYLLWLPGEARAAGIDRWWPYAVAVAGGLCFALPLFLWARERAREAAPA